MMQHLESCSISSHAASRVIDTTRNLSCNCSYYIMLHVIQKDGRTVVFVALCLLVYLSWLMLVGVGLLVYVGMSFMAYAACCKLVGACWYESVWS